MTIRLTRRRFVAAAATGTSLMTGAYPVWAMPDQGARLLLIDPSLAAAREVAMAGSTFPDGVIALDRDMVRSWRDDIRARVRASGHSLAIVRWAEAQILAGLVREDFGRSRIRALGGNAYELSLSLNRSSN